MLPMAGRIPGIFQADRLADASHEEHAERSE
jgi:hypothetical protein